MHNHLLTKEKKQNPGLSNLQNMLKPLLLKIKDEWSPEQICGYAKRKILFNLSHERIYQFILQNKKQGGILYKHLRHQHKKYRKRYGSPKRLGTIRNRRFYKFENLRLTISFIDFYNS